MMRFRLPSLLPCRRSRAVRRARLITWGVIALALFVGTGAYFHFRSRAAATLVNDAPAFAANLTSTLDLQAGTGKPTFTRATTASVTDFEGIIRQAKSGEARFEGARRVENLVTYSERFDNAAWGKEFSTVVPDSVMAPDGTLTADTIVEDSLTPANIYEGHGIGISVGSLADTSNYVFSVYAKAKENHIIMLGMNSKPSAREESYDSRVWFDLSNGTVLTQLGPSASPSITSVGNGWFRCNIKINTASGPYTSIIRIYSADMDGSHAQAGDGTSGIYLWGAQLENVTGQSVQTAGEYVSTNVLTSAPYHGANVDGVKYFTTKLDGSAIPDATLKGYLAERQRTNLLTYSEQFDNAAWSKTSVTVTANATTAPDGTMTADKIVDDTSSYHEIHQLSGSSSVTTYTFSVFLKQGGRRYAGVQLATAGGSTRYSVVFDLQNGTFGSSYSVGAPSGTAYAVSDAGNGWWKCQIASSNTGGAVYGMVILSDSASPTYNATLALPVYTGDNTSGIYVWGAQLEVGSFASSYIPTTSATVTRNADVLTYPGGLPAEGSIYADVELDGYINFSFVGEASAKGLSYYADTTVRLLDGTYNPTYSGAGLFSTGVKVATWWSNSRNKAKLFKGGGSSGELSYAGTFHTINTTYIGYGTYGTIRNVKIWKKALADTQLTNMTSATDSVSRGATTSTTVNVSQNSQMTEGLVGFWSFNGGDVNGTTVFDRSGSYANGTLVGSPVRTFGKVGQAISFDGADDVVTVGSSISGVKAVSFWIRPHSTTQSILDLNGTQSVDITSGTVHANGFSGETVYVDGAVSSTVPTTDWHHVVITTGSSFNASALTLGKISGAYFSGKLDEVRLYNQTLSSDAVRQLYNLGS